ncbi:MAG: DUF1080 domain-containing protein [Bacteroidota bacterium]
MKFNTTILNIIKLVSILNFLILIGCDESKDKEPWVKIFDGKTLNGWAIKGGKATYEVKNSAIVGSTVTNTPNTFLCSDSLYGDFILELEYKVDPDLNSGIQIRSNSFPYYQEGRVHGYQVEIDPSDRAWSAGIYDEARRGWVYNLNDNQKAREAFKQNQWNKYRIEAIGDTIKTWINGVPASHLIDDMTDKGFIGLQVHGIGNDKEKEGIQVAWKNLKIITTNVEQYSKTVDLKPKFTKNNLTEDELKKGWKMLWDGKTTKGWRGAKSKTFPESGWKIENGELSVLASGGGESRAGGDIVTEELYGNFELKVDFKLTEGANSGIKYFVNTYLNKGEGSAIGLEFQILDDFKHPDAKKGNHKGSRTVASLYDLIEAENKVVNPVGEWNHAYILSKNNHIEHWLNGIKVLEYERKSDDYRKLVAESKYKTWDDFGEADNGNILLQDHGDLVSFKNIKIRNLDNLK